MHLGAPSLVGDRAGRPPYHVRLGSVFLSSVRWGRSGPLIWSTGCRPKTQGVGLGGLAPQPQVLQAICQAPPTPASLDRPLLASAVCLGGVTLWAAMVATSPLPMGPEDTTHLPVHNSPPACPPSQSGLCPQALEGTARPLATPSPPGVCPVLPAVTCVLLEAMEGVPAHTTPQKIFLNKKKQT